MRNGNTTSLQDDLGGVTRGSYPTYEEWKQYIRQKVETIEKSSYPTYEEWKHHS